MKFEQFLSLGKEINFSGLKTWLGRGFWAVADQGLFSLTNFLVNIFLARWLEPEEYGAFSITLSIYYFLMGLYSAVMTEPMTVFGAGKYHQYFRKYLGILFYGHWVISAFIAFLLGGIAFITYKLNSAIVAHSLLGLIIATPPLLLLWLMRRAPYVVMRTQWAVIGGGLNLLVTLAGIILMRQLNLLTSLSSLVLLGIAAVLASLVILIKMKPQLIGFSGFPTPKIIFTEHKSYGIWGIPAFIAYWTSGQILIFLVPIFEGLTASAKLAAIWNLYKPIGLLIQSFSPMLISVISRWNAINMDSNEQIRRLKWMVMVSFGCVGFYSLMLTSLNGYILSFIYENKYSNNGNLVGLSGAIWTIAFILSILVGFLKAQRRVYDVFRIYSISTILSIGLGVIAIKLLALEGALYVFLLSYTISTILAYVSIVRKRG
ncbi:hypothetical protein [Thermanaerothrix sp.]|uniref:hypothetical protein n=1 Tax=Thermanaerothrix sp. TaxID=2972675 RepID=UPI002ADE306B|nr:hypothetical protein [Thermanaerothrix sp.]